MHGARGEEILGGLLSLQTPMVPQKNAARYGALLRTLTDRACSLHVGVEEGAQVGAEGVQQPTYPADG
mgnify:CR=1 FL=1